MIPPFTTASSTGSAMAPGCPTPCSASMPGLRSWYRRSRPGDRRAASYRWRASCWQRRATSGSTAGRTVAAARYDEPYCRYAVLADGDLRRRPVAPARPAIAKAARPVPGLAVPRGNQPGERKKTRCIAAPGSGVSAGGTSVGWASAHPELNNDRPARHARRYRGLRVRPRPWRACPGSCRSRGRSAWHRSTTRPASR